jgi:NADH dehydrogenase
LSYAILVVHDAVSRRRGSAQPPFSPFVVTMPQSNPKVVILGAGFGGLEATKTLARAPVEITLIDRQNYHCFQPLLYQVATAALSPADIAWPIRHILRQQKNATVFMTEVTGLMLGRAS